MFKRMNHDAITRRRGALPPGLSAAELHAAAEQRILAGDSHEYELYSSKESWGGENWTGRHEVADRGDR